MPIGLAAVLRCRELIELREDFGKIHRSDEDALGERVDQAQHTAEFALGE